MSQAGGGVKKESPIFVKSYELLLWVLQHTRKFPKDQRFVTARRIEEASLDLLDGLVAAGRARDRAAVLRALHDADHHLSSCTTGSPTI